MYRHLNKIIFLFFFTFSLNSYSEEISIPKQDWTFKGITGKYQRHEYLTQEEFQAMYDTPTPFMDKTQTRRFFIFSCLTGLPHRECMKLKWSDFHKETDKNGKANWQYLFS